MTDKTVLVTGAAGNLGKGVVEKFLAECSNVVGLVRRKSSPQQSNSRYEERLLDLLNTKDAEATVLDVIAKYKTIDVAVLTAGGFALGDIAATQTADMMSQIQLNFETAYNVARPVFLQMLKQGSGRIFLIGSKAGLDISKAKGVAAYAISKSLVFRLAELMNAEAHGTNVVAAVIVPGIIDTPQNRMAMPGADFNKWVTSTQIADVIHFYSTAGAGATREPIIKMYNAV